jgi:hypothetical protein
MEIGVADAAEQNFDLNIVLTWIAPRDCRAGKWRGRTGSVVSFRVVHGYILLFVSASS